MLIVWYVFRVWLNSYYYCLRCAMFWSCWCYSATFYSFVCKAWSWKVSWCRHTWLQCFRMVHFSSGSYFCGVWSVLVSFSVNNIFASVATLLMFQENCNTSFTLLSNFNFILVFILAYLFMFSFCFYKLFCFDFNVFLCWFQCQLTFHIPSFFSFQFQF